ncbi:hypothetical protein J437_LFUL010887 [Ladona fulva]|uniref:HTH OST-type domain-containing protein n=1 Tax=Ladona fulva TaxID=123851 RepID=A0A8K0KF54_LADFU|nr:hypothetical protein J437_LFUL010887 [Ladona fulva]
MEEEDVCELVRSVIMSEKGGVLLKNLNRDFISLAGEPIPYEKLGYKSIEDLLRIIPDVTRSVNRNGEILYTSTGKNCEHLASLISKQKGSKSKSSNHVVSHPKHIVSHHRNGYSGMHQGKKAVRRNSGLSVDHSTKGSPHQKSFADKKHIPKEKDISTTEKKLGLEPGSVVKIDLPRLRRSQEGHRRSTPDRILWESSRFNDSRTKDDEMPALVSNRLIWNSEPNTFQIPDKSPGFYRDSFQYSEGTKRKTGTDLRSMLSSNHSRDFLNGKMRSDNFKVNHFSHRDSPRLRGRFSYDVHDLECYRRESSGIPACSSLYDDHNQYGWKDRDGSRWDTEDNRSNYTDRKFDFVSGMLRVTIKNS